MHRSSRRNRALVAVLMMVGGTTACTGTSSSPGNGAPLLGRWGGEHIGLMLNESSGVVEYDCAHGGIIGPLVPSAGRIDATGVHVPEHGGPMRVGEIPDSLPARYAGRVSGDRLTLQVIVGADTLGPFALRRGAEARVFKCL